MTRDLMAALRASFEAATGEPTGDRCESCGKRPPRFEITLPDGAGTFRLCLDDAVSHIREQGADDIREVEAVVPQVDPAVARRHPPYTRGLCPYCSVSLESQCPYHGPRAS